MPPPAVGFGATKPKAKARKARGLGGKKPAATAAAAPAAPTAAATPAPAAAAPSAATAAGREQQSLVEAAREPMSLVEQAEVARSQRAAAKAAAQEDAARERAACALQRWARRMGGRRRGRAELCARWDAELAALPAPLAPAPALHRLVRLLLLLGEARARRRGRLAAMCRRVVASVEAGGAGSYPALCLHPRFAPSFLRAAPRLCAMAVAALVPGGGSGSGSGKTTGAEAKQGKEVEVVREGAEQEGRDDWKPALRLLLALSSSASWAISEKLGALQLQGLSIVAAQVIYLRIPLQQPACGFLR